MRKIVILFISFFTINNIFAKGGGSCFGYGMLGGFLGGQISQPRQQTVVVERPAPQPAPQYYYPPASEPRYYHENTCERELRARERELDLRERELAAKERELRLKNLEK